MQLWRDSLGVFWRYLRRTSYPSRVCSSFPRYPQMLFGRTHHPPALKESAQGLQHLRRHRSHRHSHPPLLHNLHLRPLLSRTRLEAPGKLLMVYNHQRFTGIIPCSPAHHHTTSHPLLKMGMRTWLAQLMESPMLSRMMTQRGCKQLPGSYLSCANKARFCAFRGQQGDAPS